MATEYLGHIKEGVIDSSAKVVEMIAASANIPIWSPVILAATGSGEDLPRCDTTNTAGDPLVNGVAVE